MRVQWTVGLLSLVGALGCNASSPSGNVRTTPEDAGASSEAIESRCRAGCVAIVSAGCTSLPVCEASCADGANEYRALDAACRGAYEAFLNCAYSQPSYTCTGSGVRLPEACSDALAAARACRRALADSGVRNDRESECQAICSHYRECLSADYNVSACQNRCVARAEESPDNDRAVEVCTACIDNRPCTPATFSCVSECGGIIP